MLKYFKSAHEKWKALREEFADRNAPSSVKAKFKQVQRKTMRKCCVIFEEVPESDSCPN